MLLVIYNNLVINNSVIRDLEKVYFNEGLYEDNFDIFGKEHSARQFYTMPVNSIVNDQEHLLNGVIGDHLLVKKVMVFNVL